MTAKNDDALEEEIKKTKFYEASIFDEGEFSIPAFVRRAVGYWIGNTPENAAVSIPCMEGFISIEDALKAVEQSPEELTRLPKGFITPEMCLVAVQKDGRMLKHVPEVLKTPEVCLAAVQNNGWALKFVPKVLKKEIRAAIKLAQEAIDQEYSE